MRLGWSQEGLCKGICAVSWLSKIEQGQVSADPQLIRFLFARLGKTWQDDPSALAAGERLLDALYAAFLSGDEIQGKALAPELSAQWETLSCSPLLPDAAALRAYWLNEPDSVPMELEKLLEPKQRCLCALARQDSGLAWELYPCAATLFALGARRYAAGDCAQALEDMGRAYDLACQEGYVRLMMHCKLYMAMACSDIGDLPRMDAHNRIAERIARAVGDEEILQAIVYNTMATKVEQGDYSAGYVYFSTLTDPGALDLHKLAVCCEKLGKRTEAREALDRAEQIPGVSEDIRQMCALVRFRLDHDDYLSQESYGALLLSTFSTLRRDRSKGFAGFHLPWVLEWFTANRAYRQAYETLVDFLK